MCPRLLQIGPFTIYGYGLMLAIGFIVANALLTSELRRKEMNIDVSVPFLQISRALFMVVVGLFVVTFSMQQSPGSILDYLISSPLHMILTVLAIGAGWFLFAPAVTKKPAKAQHFDLATAITFIALVGGVLGSKLLFLAENGKEFLSEPFALAFSPSGLTFFGGLILVTALLYWTCRKASISFLSMADATAPGLLLAYGIGRIGCHLAGDGDYGFPTTLPWGTDYSKGTYPPSIAFKDFPEITSKFPGGIVPDTTPCHPTPMYEFLICGLLFLVLWRYRATLKPSGKLFMLYLMFAGAERFAVEFIRVNPRLAFGLSEAQLIGVALFLIGAFGWFRLSQRLSS
jgi:phosphatidylglycerol---prolipoprotein diacylglyceryl transferase